MLSGLFALTALGMRQYLENVLISETLVADLDNAMNVIISGGDVSEGFSSRYYAWSGRPENAGAGLPGALPQDQDLLVRRAELLGYPTGIYDLETANHNYKVAVNKRPGIWGYVVYDATPNPRENVLLVVFLASAFMLFTLLALVLAIWSSKRIMSPVSDLAQRISTMGSDVHPEPLAPNYADDEVGQLAQALDDYAERLTELVVRDKEFNADVSHELRTPLAVIMSATELLDAQPDVTDKMRTRLDRIKRAAKQSTELTEALLHLVRAERADRQTGEYFRVDKIVEEVIDFKKNQIGPKDIDINLNVKESFLVCAPGSVIAVAAGNLIGNAIKYTLTGSVDITVDKGLVIVEDTGPGLERDELQKVFTRHYRGSSASGKGSGLGLAIVQRFCDLYGWDVRIESREGGGLRAMLDFGKSV